MTNTINKMVLNQVEFLTTGKLKEGTDDPLDALARADSGTTTTNTGTEPDASIGIE